MKLDPQIFRYITKQERRILNAIEIGLKNHEYVPLPLIEALACLKRGDTFNLLHNLLKHKLVAHNGKNFDGYKLTYNGFDYLAIYALVKRGSIVSVGQRVGVGKESDVHMCKGPNGSSLAIKFHRLGRVSFRTVKRNRDYLQHRKNASWMYLSRLAATKEYAYLNALNDAKFPVPGPVDHSRHAVLMKFVKNSTSLYQIRHLNNPEAVLEKLMRLLVQFGGSGLIHGDFNEFNLMIHDKDELRVTVRNFSSFMNF